MKSFLILAIGAAFSICIFAQTQRLSYTDLQMKVLKEVPTQPTDPIVKTSEDWANVLNEQEFYVLRKSGTEPPHSAIYKQFAKQGEGVYYCSGCGAELFSSTTKFDSGSGWPSFYDGVMKNIKLDEDHHLGYKRVEVRCNKCDGHLGHVFEGESFNNPTDKRYCINGVCLSFVPAEAEKD